MSATTWSKFFWADWESDESLKLCSPGAQALWMRMLCVCAKSGGYLTIGGVKLCPDDMAKLTGWPLKDIKTWWAELQKWEVFSIERKGTVYCRRMVKETRRSQVGQESGARGGNPHLTNKYNKPGALYLVGRRSDGSYKVGISINPTARLKRIKEQNPGERLALIECWEVADMGASEAEVLALFSHKRRGEWLFLDYADLGKLKEKFEPLLGPRKGRSGRAISHKPDSPQTPHGGASIKLPEWKGSPDILRALSEHPDGQAWALTWLARCREQHVPFRALVTSSGMAADRLKQQAEGALRAIGVRIVLEEAA